MGFASIDETIALGAPVVRLFRIGLGRDPNPVELDGYATLSRDGGTLQDLAAELARTAEFRQRHGDVATVDAGCAARLAAGIGGPALPSVTIADGLIGQSHEAALAWLTASPAAEAISLLPGLAPGAAPDDPTAYRLWIMLYDAAPPDAGDAPGMRFSLVIGVGDREAEDALATAESLRAQSHGGWELLLACHARAPWARGQLRKLAEAEPRVQLLQGEAGEAVPAMLARATAMAGPLVGFLSAGDRLAPSALRRVGAALRSDPAAAFVFTDEDRLAGGIRVAPRLKPACSPDALLAGDVVGQLAIFRREAVEAVGGMRPEAWPHHVHDLARRLVQARGAATARHLPAVLFHRAGAWREPQTVPPVVAAPSELVSIIVPTRDGAELLANCARGVLERTDYSAIELLIVDNGTREPAALDLLARLAKDERVRVLAQPGPFNFAALNNAAARVARGRVLVLMNNDVEVLAPGWLGHMAAHALRPDVGAVGAKLLYPDGTVQHAGLLLGPAGRATHVGRFAPGDAPGYLEQLTRTRDLCAVTGACLAMRAEVWARVGGMDERLAVTWNDVDLCLRARAAGLRVVWTPKAVLRHAEGRTRGMDAQDAAKVARFRAEQALMRQIWGNALDEDPYLNPNLVVLDDGRICLSKPRISAS